MDTHPYAGQMGLQVFCDCSVMTFHMAYTILSEVTGPMSVLLEGLPPGLSAHEVAKRLGGGRNARRDGESETLEKFQKICLS